MTKIFEVLLFISFLKQPLTILSPFTIPYPCQGPWEGSWPPRMEKAVCISRSDCAPFRKTFRQLEELLLLVQQAAGMGH